MVRIITKKNLLILAAAILMLSMVGCAANKSGIEGAQAEKNAGAEGSNAENEESSVNPEEIFGYEAEADDVERIASDVAEIEAPKGKDAGSDNAKNDEIKFADTDGVSSTNTYHSPIDFQTLKNQNPEIIAWLSVPGTNISYPVCQSSTNDAYYLNHNSDKKIDVNGAIFTEAAYNLNDFSDPVTVVYGHNMKSGRMFGYLEETFRDGLNGHDEAIVYLPNGEIHYKIFAALRVPSGHLLDGKNMYMPKVFTNFANSITGNKDLYSVIDHSVKVEDVDKLLVMSTCVGGDPSQRYIVVGKRIREDSGDANRRMTGEASIGFVKG